MAWLLDTNVISEFRKPKAEPKVLQFVSSAPLSELYVSIVNLVEIRYGIELSPDAQKRAALQDWLTFKVRPMFDHQRTLLVTEDILLKWRVLMEDGRKTGHTFSQPDLQGMSLPLPFRCESRARCSGLLLAWPQFRSAWCGSPLAR